jgi:hypothetical protein
MSSINLPQHIRIHMGQPADAANAQPGIDIDMPDAETVVNINIGNVSPNQASDKKQVNINLPNGDTFQRSAEGQNTPTENTAQAGGQDFFQQGANQSNSANSFAGLAPQQQALPAFSQTPAQTPSVPFGTEGASSPQAQPDVLFPQGIETQQPPTEASNVLVPWANNTPSTPVENGQPSQSNASNAFWSTPATPTQNPPTQGVYAPQPPTAGDNPPPMNMTIPTTAQTSPTPNTIRYNASTPPGMNSSPSPNSTPDNGFSPTQASPITNSTTPMAYSDAWLPQATSTNYPSGGFNPTSAQPSDANGLQQPSATSLQPAQPQDAMKQQLLQSYQQVQDDYSKLNDAYQQFEAAKSQYIQHNAQYESLGSTLNDMAYNQLALSNNPYAAAYPGSVPMAGYPKPQLGQPVKSTQGMYPQQPQQDTFTPSAAPQQGQPTPPQGMPQGVQPSQPPSTVTLQQPGQGGGQMPPITKQDVSNLRQMMMMSPETAQMAQSVSDEELAQMLNSDPQMAGMIKQLGAMVPPAQGQAGNPTGNGATEQGMQTPASPNKALEIAMQNPQAMAQAQAMVNSLSPQERQELEKQLMNDPQAQAALMQMGLIAPPPQGNGAKPAQAPSIPARKAS